MPQFKSPKPEKTLMDFLHSTYSSCAYLAEWNRKDLELRMIKLGIEGNSGLRD